VRDKTTIQQAVASVSDGGHTRLARHRNRSRHRRYGRFRSCGGVLVPGFLTVQASCRGGLSVERPGVGGASWTATRLCCSRCRSNWRSTASYQMITVNLPATTRNYMPLTPHYLSFSSIAAWRMPSARCTLTPCSFCPWRSKEAGSPAEYRRRYQYPSEHKHMEDAVSPTLALTFSQGSG